MPSPGIIQARTRASLKTNNLKGQITNLRLIRQITNLPYNGLKAGFTEKKGLRPEVGLPAGE
jgi:hypothetical protein